MLGLNLQLLLSLEVSQVSRDAELRLTLRETRRLGLHHSELLVIARLSFLLRARSQTLGISFRSRSSPLGVVPGVERTDLVLVELEDVIHKGFPRKFLMI